jgi:NAD(P)-dependent dehydrogenase (short-subunit alcohol dehydrogenase family)
MTLQETIMPENPVDKRPKPPFPPQAQWTPGATSKLDPQPDHGERSYNGHGRLHGKTALITVADSGIGRAVAIAFAREGADVGISYLSEDEDAAATSHWVRDAGQRAGQPAELAPAYVLLASDEASYMTGAIVPVAGGRPIL